MNRMDRMTFEHHPHGTLHGCLFFLFLCSLAHEFYARTSQHPMEVILSILFILAILSAVVVDR